MSDAIPDQIVDRVLLGVDAVIFDDDENVLMLHRQVKGEQFRTGWEYVKGGVKVGETFQEAARREIREEAGAAVEVAFVGEIERDFEVDARYRQKPKYDYVRKRAVVYRYISGPITVDAAEHSGYRWMPLSEARKEIWVEFGRDIFDLALQLLRNR